MASTYTTGFGIEKIGSGEQSGAWGTTTNHNLDILDRIASYKAVALSGTTHTLTVREASPGSGTENLQDGMYRVIKFTGALGGNNTVTIAPNTAPAYFIFENATTDSGSSGPYSVILTQGSGANVTIQNGKNAIVYCDGAGGGAAVVNALSDLQIATLEVTGAAAIDGALTAAAITATTVTTSGILSVDDTTTSTSGTTGSIHTDGGLGVAGTAFVAGTATVGGASQFNSTVTVGVNDTGYDVKLFGATSGKSLLWDESADSLIVTGTTTLVGTTNLDAVDIDGAVQIDATLSVGVDDTGYDVKFFGDTASAYMLWDTSADDLILGGAARLGVGNAPAADMVLDVNGQIKSGTTGAALDTTPGGFGTFIQTASSGQCAVMAYSSGGAATLSLHSNAAAAAVVENIRMTPTVVTVNENSLDMDFRVESNGNANMLFVDGGNDVVGIGTAAPYTTTKLNVAGATSTNTTAYNATNPPAAGQLDIRSTDAYGTQLGGKLTFSAISGADGNAAGKAVYGAIQGYKTNATINNSGGGLILSTTVNATGVLTERIRIEGEGSVLVATTGTASFPYTGSLFVGDRGVTDCIQTYRSGTGGAGHIGFNNPNGRVGEIYTTGSTTVYNTSSDYRLKENVVYDWDATTRLKQLKPSRFNFIADADTTFDGFLAHEAQAVVPECVTGVKDEVDADGNPILQGIDQSKIVPLLVKTIQELEARITALEG